VPPLSLIPWQDILDIATGAREASFGPPLFDLRTCALRPAAAATGLSGPKDLPGLPWSAPLRCCARQKRHARLNGICRLKRRNELARGFCSGLGCAQSTLMQAGAIKQICFLATPYGAMHAD
jgi:hypothetical protein